MKKTLFVVLIICIASCSSIKNHNEHLNDVISEQDLKSDTDFIYKKLQDLHPKLNWYISKEKLDFKFDSIKQTISKPITSLDFYKKITPVINSVRQGHMFVTPISKKYTKQEIAAFKKRGENPIAQFDFEVFNDKLYVVKNKSTNKSIAIGTEVVAINNEKVSNLLPEYAKCFTSDGFNKTLKNNLLGQRFSNFYNLFNVSSDSIKYDFALKNEIKSVVVKRQVVDSTAIKAAKIVLSKEQKKAIAKKKDIFGYDVKTKKYMRNLSFVEKDSSIAIIKIQGFKEGDSDEFYKQSFQKIKDFKSKTLVIDLRNNPGGRLSEIADLYSYLVDKDFYFVDKSLVTKKTSLMYSDYYKGGGVAGKILKTIFAPFYYPIMYFSVHKFENKFYSYSNSKLKKPKENNFKGKVYVLINGGSFSASCIISSNLKATKRATFVGQETGGAFNGTVAGRMPVFTLPKSEIAVKMGLMAVIPTYKTEIEGHGIYPDKEIVPSLQDRIDNKDPEMNWIMSDIQNK